MVYLDRWPARLDLENLVYRPLLSALTFLGPSLRPGGRLRRRLAGAAGGERILFTWPRHLCAEAGRELRHIRTETLRFLTEDILLILCWQAEG